jgi:hypothetical protein
MYAMTLTGTLPREDAEPLTIRGVCDAADVLKVFDSLLDAAALHGMSDIVVRFEGGTYSSRLEFLDMIFTINAFSTANNGCKVWM